MRVASLVSGVRLVTHAVPVGFSGPHGSGSESTCTTVLRVPSTAMSSRTQKKCWWCGPYRPGATSVPCSGRSPTASAPVEIMPESLTSYSIVPSV